MAKKEETSKKVLERVYIIPLRRETLKVPYFRKANKASKTVREFVAKHMKSDNVAIGKYLNLNIWKHGAKNPPHHVKVNAVKDDKGKVFVELVGAPKEISKPEDKKKTLKKEEGEEKEIKETKAEKPEEKLEKEIEEKKEAKAEEAKKIEEEEIKEIRKEIPRHAPKIPAKTKMQDVHPTAPRSV